MISFSNPALLWSLTALSIPLAIHLLSRKEGRVIYIGSLRYLSESNTKQSLNIRLNELLLLTLRCLLIILLALLISGLQWQSSQLTEKKWLLMEKGLEVNPQIHSILDSLRDNGYEPHFLTDGFPLLNDSAELYEINNYYDLIDQLKNEFVTKAVIFSYNLDWRFRGQRSLLPEFVTWIAVEPSPVEFPVRAARTGNDSLQVRIGRSNSGETYFQTVVTKASPADLYYSMPLYPDSIIIISPDSIVITLAGDPAYDYDRKIIRVALESLNEFVREKIKIVEYPIGSTVSNHHSDWIFWLSRKAVPSGNFRNRVVLLEDPASPLLVRNDNVQWNLTKRLNPDIALRENLAIQLSKMLFPAKEALQAALKNDQRVMPEKMAWKRGGAREVESVKSGLTAADPFLILMILFTLIIERAIANNRNQ